VAAKKKSWGVLVGEYTSLAFMLPLATFLGYAFGYLLDKAFGTHWIYIPGLLFGIAAGLLQVIRYVLRDTRDE
jgi:F0F1-type ATP synthase assembly protein I